MYNKNDHNNYYYSDYRDYAGRSTGSIIWDIIKSIFRVILVFIAIIMCFVLFYGTIILLIVNIKGFTDVEWTIKYKYSTQHIGTFHITKSYLTIFLNILFPSLLLSPFIYKRIKNKDKFQ